MIDFISLIAAAATAVVAQPQLSQSQQDPIVITGQRLQDFRQRLADCLARNCPPDEDIRASTALAEVLFFAGDYRDARAVLRSAVGRNRKEASRYPEPVSELYRADARVARHLGFDDEAQRSTREILSSLKAGIPIEDGRHFTARLEIIHSLIFFGRLEEAERALGELASAARRASREDVLITAEMQKLWIDYKRGQWNPVQRRLLQLARFGDPNRSVAAKILLIRAYGERGETRRADAVIAQLGKGGKKRAILYEPEYQLRQYEEVMGIEARLNSGVPRAPVVKGPIIMGRGRPIATLADRVTDNFEDAWIDVAFKVRADGTVDDLQVVRRGPGAQGWEDPLLKAVKGRRYTLAESGRDTMKIERFSYTSRLWSGAGSRIPSRSLRARVEKN